MMHGHNCLVPGCRRPSVYHVSYHSLPKSEELAKYWLEVCGRLDLLKSKSRKNIKICSAHFSESDYTNYLQYALMTSGSPTARPCLKEDAVPTFGTPGWKRIRRAPLEIRMTPSRHTSRDQLRQHYVSQALHEYETGQLSGDPVQDIRSRLKMRWAYRPHVQVEQVGRRDGQMQAGGTISELGSAAARAGRETGPASVRASMSCGIAEQPSNERSGDLNAQDDNDVTEITWSPPKSATTSSLPRDARNVMGATSNELSATHVNAARLRSDRLPAKMPGRFRAVLSRQRTICSLQLTLRRQTEELQALQTRHQLELEEQGGAEVALFPPADTSLAGEDAIAGGDMLLTPATLGEATAELHRLRTEVLELRTGLLNSAVAANERALAANERALAANSQRTELLRVFTPRQADILVGRRARSDTWDAEDLRRAISLRYVLTRRQYEHLRTSLQLPLPALCATAAALQTEPEKRRLYHRLLDRRRWGPDRPVSPDGPAGFRSATAVPRRPDGLLVLRGATAAGGVRPGQWDGLDAGREERADQTKPEEHVEHTDEMVGEVDPLDLTELLHGRTVRDEVGREGEQPGSAARSRPMTMAIAPAQRDDLPLEYHESLLGDLI